MLLSELPQIRSIKTPDQSIGDGKKPRRFKYINIPLILVSVLLVSYGLLVVWSAVYSNELYSFSRQLAGVLIGAILMVAFWRFDYRFFGNFTTVLLVVNIVLLLMPHVPLIGVDAKGAQSWVNLFGFQFQPGELAKITVILLAASVVARYGGRLDDRREYLKVLAILAVPFLCIMTQPDMGTGLVYLFIAATALVAGGARPKFLLVTVGVLVGLVVFVLILDPILDAALGRDVLVKEYQWGRLFVFLDPEHDLSGEGYNLAQAKIAIGSGGLFGKGLLQATQSSYGYLPEAPTDFIFCVLAEEFGFFGVVVLLGLYAALVVVCFKIASSSSDLFGTLIVMCAVGMWLFQILENIGMTCGLMPITGIPLPFMSYAPSFMLVNFVVLGLIGSVWAHGGQEMRM